VRCVKADLDRRQVIAALLVIIDRNCSALLHIGLKEC
jgi:hypothetical protein